METYQTDLGLSRWVRYQAPPLGSGFDKQSMDYIRDQLLRAKIWTSYWPTKQGQEDIWLYQVLPTIIEVWETLPSPADADASSCGLVPGAFMVSNSALLNCPLYGYREIFVSEWNVYKKRKDGSINFNPKHYKIEDGADNDVRDSANYGRLRLECHPTRLPSHIPLLSHCCHLPTMRLDARW